MGFGVEGSLGVSLFALCKALGHFFLEQPKGPTWKLITPVIPSGFEAERWEMIATAKGATGLRLGALATTGARGVAATEADALPATATATAAAAAAINAIATATKDSSTVGRRGRATGSKLATDQFHVVGVVCEKGRVL